MSRFWSFLKLAYRDFWSFLPQVSSDPIDVQSLENGDRVSLLH